MNTPSGAVPIWPGQTELQSAWPGGFSAGDTVLHKRQLAKVIRLPVGWGDDANGCVPIVFVGRESGFYWVSASELQSV